MKSNLGSYEAKIRSAVNKFQFPHFLLLLILSNRKVF